MPTLRFYLVSLKRRKQRKNTSWSFTLRLGLFTYLTVPTLVHTIAILYNLCHYSTFLFERPFIVKEISPWECINRVVIETDLISWIAFR